MIGFRSTESTWLMTTETFGSAAPSRSAARSRSISIASSRRTCAASGRVMAPLPGPISRIESSGAAATAVTSLPTHAASRKCCANRLRALIAVVLVELFLTPDLFDDVDLLFGHAEVVPQLVNERLA